MHSEAKNATLGLASHTVLLLAPSLATVGPHPMISQNLNQLNKAENPFMVKLGMSDANTLKTNKSDF